MSDNSSFNSEELSDDSVEEEDTKSQTDKDKEKAKGNSPENKDTKNINLINSITKTLNTILEQNKKLKNYKDILKKQISMYFSANTIPNISIKDYLIRIQNYSEMEKSTLILSLILIDKMCKKSGIVLTHYNIHRILFSSVLISINIKIGVWGLGIGDWGLGIGPNPQSPIPNPQSPIPNPHIILY